MKYYGVIYKIINNVNGKIYIGQTVRAIEERINEHFKETCKNLKYPLQKAIVKYGEENFAVEIIEKCLTKKILDEREKYWIKFYRFNDHRFVYNIAEGGSGSGSGKDSPNYISGKYCEKRFCKKCGRGLCSENKNGLCIHCSGKQGINNPMFNKLSPAKDKIWLCNNTLNIDKLLDIEKAQDLINNGWIKGRSVNFCQKISGKNNPSYGKLPWNKNLTKETDERVKRNGENVHNASLKKTIW